MVEKLGESSNGRRNPTLRAGHRSRLSGGDQVDETITNLSSSAVPEEIELSVRPAHPGCRESAGDTEGIRKQLHLRLFPEDDARLRQLAEQRGQTLSGAVRYLVRKEERSRKA